MIRKSKMKLVAMALLFGALGTALPAQGGDFVVYSVFRGLDLGNPGEEPQKDYYINMGSSNGLQEGSVLEVMRKVATYDLLSEKLYKDVQFPIARVKVIHVENNAAIARLDKMMPAESTPAVTGRFIMVGDMVRITAAKSE